MLKIFVSFAVAGHLPDSYIRSVEHVRHVYDSASRIL